jgi:hypothetical protein
LKFLIFKILIFLIKSDMCRVFIGTNVAT